MTFSICDRVAAIELQRSRVEITFVMRFAAELKSSTSRAPTKKPALTEVKTGLRISELQ